MRRYTLYKYISRLMACLMALVLVLTFSPTAHAQEESGTCGDDLTWSFSAGTLTITGSGDMTDFSESTMAPWYQLRGEILSLSLPEGLTSVGMLAFYGCENLTVVHIPEAVTRIGSYAFAKCTGMTMLTLGSGVQTIDQCAFSDCVSLTALNLPDGLRVIGEKAFYRCESIPAVTIPAGVERLGMSAFAYCKSLVSARVYAGIQTIPEWLFYNCHRLVSVTLPDTMEQISEFSFRGCEQLASVYYDGSSCTQEEVRDLIGTNVPGFQGTGLVSSDQPPASATSGTTQENEDSTTTQENVTAIQGEHMTASINIETIRNEDGTGISTAMKIQVTVENEEGWSQAKDTVLEALSDYNNNMAKMNGKDETIQIDVFVKNADIDTDFMNTIADRNITMNIATQDGSHWRLDGNVVEVQEEAGAYDLRYTMTPGSEELCQELGVSSCYVLRFLSSAKSNVETLFRLGESFAQQNATLLYKGEELSQIQSTVVDQQGNAHFYLANVVKDTDYYIAINLPETDQEVIVPDELLSVYGQAERYSPIKYEITGVKSSLGVSFGQVTGILIAVVVVCVVVIGVVMYMFHKRKLKMEVINTPESGDIP